MLEHVLKRDAGAFMKLIADERDGRNVCGVPGIYGLLRILAPGEAKLLHYEIAEEPQTQSLVSFASAAFYESTEA